MIQATKIVNVHEAKTHLSRLLEDVLSGEEVILARNGKPLARIVALTDDAERELGFVAYKVPDSFFDPLPEEELDAWHSTNDIS